MFITAFIMSFDLLLEFFSYISNYIQSEILCKPIFGKILKRKAEPARSGAEPEVLAPQKRFFAFVWAWFSGGSA
nr:hypothetical protein [Ectobacillus panaciterrae]